jgi:hypothetical protein
VQIRELGGLFKKRFLDGSLLLDEAAKARQVSGTGACYPASVELANQPTFQMCIMNVDVGILMRTESRETCIWRGLSKDRGTYAQIPSPSSVIDLQFIAIPSEIFHFLEEVLQPSLIVLFQNTLLVCLSGLDL